MSIPVYEPKCSVLLKKNIGRTEAVGGFPTSERFRGEDRVIDLTPFLHEHGAVVVRKSVRQSAGMFSITLADRMVNDETLYALIEPMDVIEVRMARDTSVYAGGGLERSMPMMMRGLVSDVRRGQIMTDRGPQRAVVVSGQDYGKILAILQIAYLPNMVTGDRLVSYFKFFEKYAPGSPVLQPAAEFVSEVVAKVINPFLQDMQDAVFASGLPGAGSPIMQITADTERVIDGIVSAFGTNQWPGGTVDSLLRYYGDVGPWNELFVEDREDGPYLVYRPNPFKGGLGGFIQEPYKSKPDLRPAVNTITDQDMPQIEVCRSDSDVANYYWVDAPRYALVDGRLLQAGIAHQGEADLFYLKDYPNSDPKLYGFRQMILETQQGPRFDGQKEKDYEQGHADLFAFITRRREVIIETNKDNVVFESGTVQMKGNEAIKAGTYLTMKFGARAETDGMVSEAYVPEVTHTFSPFRGFVTNAAFERGTGFIERATRGSDVTAPYLAELNLRGVYAAR